MTRETSDENVKLFSLFEANLAKAQATFAGAMVSPVVIMAATLQEIPVPDRAGGHDYGRGAGYGGQVGKGSSASDHGIAQGNRYIEWGKQINLDPEHKTKASDMLKQFKAQRQPKEATEHKDDKSKRHTAKEMKQAELAKMTRKAATATQKKAKYEAAQTQTSAPSFGSGAALAAHTAVPSWQKDLNTLGSLTPSSTPKKSDDGKAKER